MSQASDRFNISFDKPLSSSKKQIPIKNFIPEKPQTDSRFDFDVDVSRYAKHRKPEYTNQPSERFSGFDTSIDSIPVRESSDRFAGIHVAERISVRESSDRFADIHVAERIPRGDSMPSKGSIDARFDFNVSEMQDPRHMVRSRQVSNLTNDVPTMKISIRNKFADLIDHAIVQKSVPVEDKTTRSGGGAGSEKPQTKPQKKQNKKNMSNLDDLDDDEPINKAANKAILAKLAEEEGEEESEDESEENSGPLTKAERKAIKQQKKRERLTAAGMGYKYQQ